jgi:hypothetical protein
MLFESEWTSFKNLQLGETAIPNTMGWSTCLNGRQYDFDEFTREFQQIADHVRAQQAPGV